MPTLPWSYGCANPNVASCNKEDTDEDGKLVNRTTGEVRNRGLALTHAG